MGGLDPFFKNHHRNVVLCVKTETSKWSIILSPPPPKKNPRKILHDSLTAVTRQKQLHRGMSVCIPLQEALWKSSVYKTSLF